MTRLAELAALATLVLVTLAMLAIIVAAWWASVPKLRLAQRIRWRLEGWLLRWGVR